MVLQAIHIRIGLVHFILKILIGEEIFLYHINLENERIKIITLSSNDIPVLLQWYNNSHEFKYATGNDSPITFEQLYMKIAETLISENEILAGIYLKNDNKTIIGTIKGCFNST